MRAANREVLVPQLKREIGLRKREDLLAIAKDLFAVVGSGAVKIPINQKYPLRDAAKAHRELEERATTGSSILVP